MSLGRPRFNSGRGSSRQDERQDDDLGSWCNGSIWDCASQGRGSIPRLPLDDDKMNGNRRRRWSAPLGVMATHRIVAPQTSVRFREGRVIPHWRNGSAEVCRTSRGGSIPPCGSTVWSSGQDSWLSTSRLGFKSRYRNLLTWRNRNRTRLRTGRLQVQVLPWALTLTVDLMGMVPQPVS